MHFETTLQQKNFYREGLNVTSRSLPARFDGHRGRMENIHAKFIVQKNVKCIYKCMYEAVALVLLKGS